MYKQVAKTKESKSRAVGNSVAQLQEMTNNAPQVKQLIVLQPIQRAIKLKITKNGENTDMSGPDLKAEVTRLIGEGKPGEILEAIGALEQSIRTRKETKAYYDSIGYSETDNATNHEYRIALEEDCLLNLQAERERDLQSRPVKNKKQPDAKGWTTV